MSFQGTVGSNDSDYNLIFSSIQWDDLTITVDGQTYDSVAGNFESTLTGPTESTSSGCLISSVALAMDDGDVGNRPINDLSGSLKIGSACSSPD